MEKNIATLFLVWVLLGGAALFTKGIDKARPFSGCGFLKLNFHAFCFLILGPLSFFKIIRAKICQNCFG